MMDTGDFVLPLIYGVTDRSTLLTFHILAAVGSLPFPLKLYRSKPR